MLVLGLGGWFIGALVALTALPTVPLDDELLAALSIGLPVGLGVFLAWLDTERPGEAKAIGLAGALAGALVGAWLGFNVLSGLFAVITTIVGATAVSNLALARARHRVGAPGGSRARIRPVPRPQQLISKEVGRCVTHVHTPISPLAWAAGAPTTGRRRPSAGSRS